MYSQMSSGCIQVQHRTVIASFPLALVLTASLFLQKKMVSYPKLDFSVQELRERFQQQLEMELNSTITIESVESTKPLTPQAIKAVNIRVSEEVEGTSVHRVSVGKTCRVIALKWEGFLVMHFHHSVAVLLPFLV